MADIWSDIDAGTPFNLTDCKVALWNSEGSFGTAQDVPAIKSMEITTNVVSGKAEGDGGVIAVASLVEDASGVLTFTGISIDMWALITGTTKKAGGTTPNRYEAIAITPVGQCLPYFAVCGKAQSDQCGKDVHLWAPKIKVESFGGVSLMKGGFIEGTINFIAIADGTTYEAVEWVTHETATDVTIPVTYITS